MYKTIIFNKDKFAFCLADKEGFKTVSFKTWYAKKCKDTTPLHVKEAIEDKLLTGKSLAFLSLYIWHHRTNKTKFIERIKTLIK
jgi:hypothetical protein